MEGAITPRSSLRSGEVKLIKGDKVNLERISIRVTRKI